MPNKKNFKFYFAVSIFGFYIFNFIGCASVPRREVLPVYNINGVAYIPLITLCEQKNINWEYDTFTRTVFLSRDAHKVNLCVGQRMVTVDGLPQYLREPVDIYQGALVVPQKFSGQVLDTLFRAPGKDIKSVSLPARIKKVVIDAGHGGNDPGAIGRTGLREKDVNLDIAKRLARLLENENIEVVLTRSSDKFIPLASRVDIANNSKADLFISIHSNANRLKSLNGFEIYYISPGVNDSQRALSAAQEAMPDIQGKSFLPQTLDLKATIWDMLYTYNRAESIELAKSICKIVSRDLDAHILGVKAANFQVLRGCRMPAVLIEVGFLSNYNEERMLKNNVYRQRVAEDIREGIQNYAKDVTLALSGTE